MHLLKLYSFLFVLLLSFSTGADASTPLEKRATQVSLISYTFSNNVLAGSIKVRPRIHLSPVLPFLRLVLIYAVEKIQNIAYSKAVTVVYAVGSSWTTAQAFAAAYASGPASDGYETWTFSGTATGATQFYIKYVVSGVT